MYYTSGVHSLTGSDFTKLPWKINFKKLLSKPESVTSLTKKLDFTVT